MARTPKGDHIGPGAIRALVSRRVDPRNARVPNADGVLRVGFRRIERVRVIVGKHLQHAGEQCRLSTIKHAVQIKHRGRALLTTREPSLVVWIAGGVVAAMTLASAGAARRVSETLQICK
eukprot:3008172-Prymnesium_polylepis.1